MATRVRVGILGWNYPEWRGLAYPADAARDDLLRHYARLFRTVEVVGSYYKMPTTAATAEWASATPRGFEFSLKVPDWILKKRPEDGLAGALDAFLARLAPLREAKKLGMLVAQFPPFFRREKNADALARFVATLPKGERWAVELRHASWWHSDTYRTLADAGVTLAWSAVESGRTPPVLTTDDVYVRLFGDHALEKPYDSKRRNMRQELEHWAARVRDEGASAKRAKVLVSKYLEGYAPGSAATICKLLDLPVPDVGHVQGRAHARQTTLVGL